MEHVKPPFHVDIAGTFLVPPTLKVAREQYKSGVINQNSLRAIEDDEIRRLVERLKKTGLRVVTDGNFRSSSSLLEFMCHLDGIELEPVKRTTVRLVRKICVHRHPIVLDFMYLTGITGGDILAKQALPAPSLVFSRLLKDSPKEVEQFYPVIDQLLEDIKRIYQRIISALYESGCRYVQFDDTTRLITPDAIRLNNMILEQLPEDLFIAFHAPTEMLISTARVNAYFLDYDEECCSKYKLFWFVKEEKASFGFIPFYYPQDDEIDELLFKIEEVRRYIPLDRFSLCLPHAHVLPSESYEQAEEKQWHTLETAIKVAKDLYA